MKTRPNVEVIAICHLPLAICLSAFGQGTAFTYEGRLNDASGPANGVYDFRFLIFDSTNNPGVLIAGPLTNSATGVTNGFFAATLDFGTGVFNGAERWLEIGVRTNGGGAFTGLGPRQKITPTPYAITASNLTGTVSASQLSGAIANNQLPANVARLDSNAVFTGTVTFNNAAGSFRGNFFGNGAGVTNVSLGALDAPRLFSWGNFVLASSPVVGSEPFSVTTADVNGDGKLDVIDANEGSDTLSVLTNDGSGGFVLASSPGVGSQPVSVAVADVNGDGKVDLISANYDNGAGNTLSVLTNNGSIGFVLASSPGVGGAPDSVIAADVNGDGKVDLISANNSANTLTILTNNGNGGFVLAASPGVGNGPTWITAADVNGDGKVDLITANYSGNSLSILTNNGSGGFLVVPSPAVGMRPDSVVAADVNGDGKVDLISANFGISPPSTLTVLTNIGNGTFALSSSLDVDAWPSLTAADVNGDGKVDLICACLFANTLSVLTNDGSGGFVLASSPGVVGAQRSITAADVNGDGKVDLITGGFGGSTLSVLFNTPTFIGTFAGAGNGSGLTNLNASALSGTVADARLSANVALRTGGNTFSGTQAINGLIRLDSPDGFSQSSAGNFNIDTPLVVGGRFAVLTTGRTGIGTNAPQDLLHLNVAPGQGVGIRVDSAVAGHAPAISLNHTGNNGRNFRITSYGDNFFAGSFRIRDDTAGADRLIIDASGEVQIPAALNFGNQTRQMLNLWSTAYGIGVQNNTEYFRSGSEFSWFKGGIHDDAQNNPGAGGIELMRLSASGNLTVRGILTTNITLMSDRNAKENFAPVDSRAVLDKVAALLVSEWNFKSEATTRHIGPMAQDFKAAFNVGEDDKQIAVVDEGGVALAAIQGLNQKLETKSQEMEVERKRLQKENTAIKQRLETLEKIILNQKLNPN